MLLSLVAVAFLAGGRVARAQDRIVVTDIIGRDVVLPGPAHRIILAEGRQIVALSLIAPDPVGLLVGWVGDLRKNDQETYKLYQRKFPAIDSIPILGMGNDGTFSVEKAIAAKPDLAVLSISFAPGGRSSDVLRQLDAAGIPVVFTDFSSIRSRTPFPASGFSGRSRAATLRPKPSPRSIKII